MFKDIKFDIENRKMNVFLNSRFYPKQFILESIEAFNELCDGKIEEKEEHYEIELVVKDNSLLLDEVGYGFCNYCLGLMRNYSVIG